MKRCWRYSHLLRFSLKIRACVLGHSDPAVVTRINSQPAVCPFSHMLAIYQLLYPLYDIQLRRICQVIFDRTDKLSVIDVGANIGDTVLGIGNKDAYYLLFEGESKYQKYISRNLSEYRYDLESCFLTDNSDAGFSCQTKDGTGHLVKDDQGSSNMGTLDRIIDEKYSNVSFDLLKIDTDGFDFKVLRGGLSFLQKQNPLLFFEWDKHFLEMQGEDCFSIFPLLSSYGYTRIMAFDNFGRYLCSFSPDDKAKLMELVGSVDNDSIYYFDLLAIPIKWRGLEGDFLKCAGASADNVIKNLF